LLTIENNYFLQKTIYLLLILLFGVPIHLNLLSCTIEFE